LQLEVSFHLLEGYQNRGGGRSPHAVRIATEGGVAIAEGGAAFEMRTGRDPNGSEPDIEVFFDVDFLNHWYWVNPLNGSAPPAGMNDLVSVIAHEIGHALGFNGYRNATTYEPLSGHLMVFDQLVAVEAGSPVFTGAAATELYGGAVPLTAGNLFHLGNDPGPGGDLVGHLMGGVVFYTGRSYHVSLLEVAMLSDLGVPTVLADTLRGSEAGDHVYGGRGDDHIAGGAGEDQLYGESGNDILAGGAGQDLLDGGAGLDTVTFEGRRGDYDVTPTAEGWRISDLRPGAPDGVDTLRDVELVWFADDRLLGDDDLLADAAMRLLRLGAASAHLDPFKTLQSDLGLGLTTLPEAADRLLKAADATTSVATLAYQFFTGRVPSAEGLDYLVAPSGPNSNNLNSPYYQDFNLENRYINFSVNLGKLGEGRARFEAEYGALSLAEATSKAYAEIFGTRPVDQKVQLLLSGGRDAYFETYGMDGANGLGTKAAMVGWLLAEAEKADVGRYAKANAALLLDLIDGATLGIDLVAAYGRPEYDLLA
ncbi:hypothetical protein, partial [Phenylobacterium sp.]|uniref:hypothetical protein n=1 Tax=Phenylobacterium sp. TaxID=1871053 RepID=UPI0035C78E7E